MRPTPEQEEAIQAYLTGENVRIEALAGTGKTTTLTMLVNHGSPRGGKILYTAFGNKVIKDAKAKFPSSVAVRTNHSLAWGVGVQYQRAGRLQARVTPHDLISSLGLTMASFPGSIDLRSGAHAVVETIATFCQSADDGLTTRHSYLPALRLARGDQPLAQHLAQLIARYAAEAWVQMADQNARTPVTHDIYLKLWALGGPRINATTILLDEAQDANGVIVGVLQNQAHAQLVIVGDRQQAIFSWRGAVDAMDAFDFAHSTTLTQSFRFGPEIAAVASAVLRDQCERDLDLTGDPGQPGTVGKCDLPHCYLARTNAALMGQAFEVTSRFPAYRIGIVGGVEDLIKLVDGAAALQAGERTQVQDLAEFGHWRDVQEASQHEAYGHLRVLVQLVDDYGPAMLRGMLERMRGNEADPAACDVLLSTAHKAKGAEFETVKLLDDFKPKGPPGDEDRYGWSPEEGNLLYVACTRARKHLDISSCEAAMGSLPRDFAMQSLQRDDDARGEDDELDFSDPATWVPAVSTADRERVHVLREGAYDHPLIQGGLVQVTLTPAGARVVVSAMGYTLFETEGEVVLGAHQRHWIDATIGTAVLPMPFSSLSQPPGNPQGFPSSLTSAA